MIVNHTEIHKSLWEPRVYQGVTWTFFKLWAICFGLSVFICFKAFYIGLVLVITLVSIFYAFRLIYKKDWLAVKKFQRYMQYQDYYPALSNFSVCNNTNIPKTYFYDGRLIMKILRKFTNKTPKIKGEPDINADFNNPYLAGRREWMERYGDYISQSIFWRRALLISLLAVAILTGGVVILASRYKVEAQVFSLMENGSLAPITSIDTNYLLANPSIISNQLSDYIIALRTVTNDQDLLAKQQRRLETMTDGNLWGSTVYPILKANSANPQKVRISVQISYLYPDESFDKDNNKYYWRAVWDETVYDSNNAQIAKNYWQAKITLGFFTPKSKETILYNPTSILMEDLQIHSMVTNTSNSNIQQVQPIPQGKTIYQTPMAN